MDNNILNMWNSLKELITSLDFDIVKNSRGTVAAGVRARKGLRQLQTKTRELVKLTLELDKNTKYTKSKKNTKKV